MAWGIYIAKSGIMLAYRGQRWQAADRDGEALHTLKELMVVRGQRNPGMRGWFRAVSAQRIERRLRGAADPFSSDVLWHRIKCRIGTA